MLEMPLLPSKLNICKRFNIAEILMASKEVKYYTDHPIEALIHHQYKKKKMFLL